MVMGWGGGRALGRWVVWSGKARDLGSDRGYRVVTGKSGHGGAVSLRDFQFGDEGFGAGGEDGVVVEGEDGIGG
jgi:hypothetical protein